MSCCSASYQKRYDEKPTDAVLCMLTDRCHRQLISNQISKDKGNKPTKQSSNEPRPASDKQLKYLEDLGGDPTMFKSAAAASAEIERLKSK